jgi:hypothetical protein
LSLSLNHGQALNLTEGEKSITTANAAFGPGNTPLPVGSALHITASY